jgi:hypothetical protein
VPAATGATAAGGAGCAGGGAATCFFLGGEVLATVFGAGCSCFWMTSTGGSWPALGAGFAASAGGFPPGAFASWPAAGTDRTHTAHAASAYKIPERITVPQYANATHHTAGHSSGVTTTTPVITLQSEIVVRARDFFLKRGSHIPAARKQLRCCRNVKVTVRTKRSTCAKVGRSGYFVLPNFILMPPYAANGIEGEMVRASFKPGPPSAVSMSVTSSTWK